MIGGKMRMVGWICEIWCITKYLRNLNFTRGKLTILWCKFALIPPKLHHPGFSQTYLLRLSSRKSFEQPQNMDVAIFPSCQSSFSILIIMVMICFYHRKGSPSIVSVDLVNISFQLLIASDIWEWFPFSGTKTQKWRWVSWLEIGDSIDSDFVWHNHCESIFFRN